MSLAQEFPAVGAAHIQNDWNESRRLVDDKFASLFIRSDDEQCVSYSHLFLLVGEIAGKNRPVSAHGRHANKVGGVIVVVKLFSCKDAKSDVEWKQTNVEESKRFIVK